MTEELIKKIDSLIAECPGDWNAQVAEIMGVSPSSIYMIKNGHRGRRDNMKLVKIIDALNIVRDKYQTILKQATV